jgi:hypothetical protein
VQSARAATVQWTANPSPRTPNGSTTSSLGALGAAQPRAAGDSPAPATPDCFAERGCHAHVSPSQRRPEGVRCEDKRSPLCMPEEEAWPGGRSTTRSVVGRYYGGREAEARGRGTEVSGGGSGSICILFDQRRAAKSAL